MDTLWDDVGRVTLFYRIIIMDIRHMEDIEKKLSQFEEDIFNDKDIEVKEFYKLKKQLLRHGSKKLIDLHVILETMLDKQHNELMNRRLNLLTIWSTIFLPLSFYTGLWGMNFDDVPLITDDNGFWVFMGLTILTIGGMWVYFKKNKWL